MKTTCGYNKHINLVEVLPNYLNAGIKQAKLYKCGLRIMGKLSALFLDSDKFANPVDLDFSDLKQDFPKKYSTIVQIVEQARFFV